MSIELVEKYLPYVDEQFSTESKKALVTNQDFTFEGAKSVKIYSVSTAPMNDYGRRGAAPGNWSRYGEVLPLDATTQQCILSKDRSFTFVIDTLDQDETGDSMEAASALARQIRQVVIPEVDTYVFGKIIDGAGITEEPETPLSSLTVYDEIIKGSKALDDEEVPEEGRVLVVPPGTYFKMKLCKDIVMETETGEDMRIRGVIGNLDGMVVLRVPASRLPEGLNFAIIHPCATAAPVKLESYKVHQDPPGISGSLVEGRVVYDAFVLKNKKKAIYCNFAASSDGDPDTNIDGDPETDGDPDTNIDG